MEKINRARLVYIVLIIFTVSSLAVCQTVPKKFKEEVGGIKTRVETLESKVEGIEARQTESEKAAGEMAQAMGESRTRGTSISVKSSSFKGKENIKDIQTCLKNAGYYTGKIDGISGKNTRRAIREFQKSSGLNPDGIVGKKTWEFLSKYAQSTAAGGMEEGATK